MQQTDTPTTIATDDICVALNIHRSTLERWEKQGLIPPRIRIGKRRRVMLRTTFDAWLASRAPTDTAQ